MEIKPKYKIGDTVYFIEYGIRKEPVKAKIKGIIVKTGKIDWFDPIDFSKKKNKRFSIVYALCGNHQVFENDIYLNRKEFRQSVLRKLHSDIKDMEILIDGLK